MMEQVVYSQPDPMAVDPCGTLTTTGHYIQFNRLTDKEQEELERLEKQYQEEIRQKKRELFKSLAPHIRQAIVDQRVITGVLFKCVSMRNEVDKTQRQRELEVKKEGLINAHNAFAPNPLPGLNMSLTAFSEFSLEELEELHCEAVTEEIIEGDDNGQ